jgi:hypothetical protein
MHFSVKSIIYSLSLVSLSVSLYAQEEDPRQIYDRATGQMLSGDMEILLELDIKDKKGRIKEKGFEVLVGTFGEVQKTKMSWQKPEAAKGTTVIFTELPDETGLIEVYTPSNGKIRKLKATPENMKMVGSEAQMTGMTGRDADELMFAHLPGREVEGAPCFNIEVKDKESADQARGELLIEKETYRIVQISVFDKNGKQTSLVSLSDFQPVDGHETKVQPMRIITEDYKNKKQTEMRVIKVASRKDLTEEDFLLPVSDQELEM